MQMNFVAACRVWSGRVPLVGSRERPSPGTHFHGPQGPGHGADTAAQGHILHCAGAGPQGHWEPLRRDQGRRDGPQSLWSPTPVANTTALATLQLWRYGLLWNWPVSKLAFGKPVQSSLDLGRSKLQPLQRSPSPHLLSGPGFPAGESRTPVTLRTSASPPSRRSYPGGWEVSDTPSLTSAVKDSQPRTCALQQCT